MPGPKSGARTIYDVEFYRDFAKAAFEVAKFDQKQKDNIIAKLRQMGHQLAWDQLRQHIQKMIREDKAASGATAADSVNPASLGGSGTEAVHTSELRPAGQRRPRRTSKKRVAPVYDDGDDEDERPKKRMHIKTEETALTLAEMKGNESRPPRVDPTETWSMSDYILPLSPVNSLAPVFGDIYGAETTLI
ncbi:hypothetical protein F5Y05DRAFT_330508 [Hypoxylon sp. FL0543]|nr:hypothetical protein F5Y05DRAFT_330508 [Hypoxylon sp. FL0543]